MRFHGTSNLHGLMRYALYIATCAAASSCGGAGMEQSGPSIAAARTAAPPSIATDETNAAAMPAAEIATVLHLGARPTLYGDPLPPAATERDTSVPAASSVRFPARGADEPTIETF
jgi:hypothetical protein